MLTRLREKEVAEKLDPYGTDTDRPQLPTSLVDRYHAPSQLHPKIYGVEKCPASHRDPKPGNPKLLEKNSKITPRAPTPKSLNEN